MPPWSDEGGQIVLPLLPDVKSSSSGQQFPISSAKHLT